MIGLEYSNRGKKFEASVTLNFLLFFIAPAEILKKIFAIFQPITELKE
jgi:hypothetical protein